MRHVLFRVLGQSFAVPLGEVREVLVPPNVFTRVPRSPLAIRGVINLRGRIVTVVDFARLFDLSASTEPVDVTLSRIVLLEGEGRDIGLLVDEVKGIFELAQESPPVPGSRPEVVALSRMGEESVTILGVTPLVLAIRVRFESTR